MYPSYPGILGCCSNKVVCHELHVAHVSRGKEIERCPGGFLRAAAGATRASCQRQCHQFRFRHAPHLTSYRPCHPRDKLNSLELLQVCGIRNAERQRLPLRQLAICVSVLFWCGNRLICISRQRVFPHVHCRRRPASLSR